MTDQPTTDILTDDAADSGNALVLPNQSLPGSLYVIPVNNRPFLPAQVQPIEVAAAQWEATIKHVAETPHHCLALSYSASKSDERVDADQLSRMTCAVKLLHVSKSGDRIQFIAQGLRRAHIKSWIRDEGVLLANMHYPEPRERREDEVRAYAMAIITNIKELVALNPLYTEELRQYLSRFGPNDPSPLTDFAAAITTAKGDQLQDILDTVDLLPRMEKVLTLLKMELDVVKLHAEINEQVNEQISDHQRKFFLREQLKVIQKELGLTKDDNDSDREEFEARLKDKVLPDAVEKRITEEFKKLAVLEPHSAEFGVTRNYLDWVTAVPWGLYSDDNHDIRQARKVLDKHHDGLADVKDRIIEFLAVGAYRGDVSGSIMLLVGPPGVGKTSIGRAIADALGRPFYRFSLGGMRDEAEIKGHRRTYIGALPGKLVQALKDCNVANPVIMLDEIDKISSSYHGDPASALLEVLDPEQNKEFLDHYLDLRVDLSKVLFICTANQLDTIPGPLLDRMDTIRLPGYITEEKLAIAKHYLWPRALERAGVKRSQLKIGVPVLRLIIEDYAREAGVRNLEKQLNKIVRKSVVQLLENPEDRIVIGKEALTGLLGQPVFKAERDITGVGVVTGLAWTAMGGATLAIEAAGIHQRSPGYKLTGQLGDVMKESAEIAYSYMTANARHYGNEADTFDKTFIHLHVPEGATPKDGPSAGITMATALVSLATGRKLPGKLAMTGELTLTGQVLPVGGIREKVIAARRQGIKVLVLPEANRGDYEELPDYLKKGLTVHFAAHYDQVYEVLWK